MGQVIDSTQESRSDVLEKIGSYREERVRLAQLLDQIPVIDTELIDSYFNMMKIYSDSITFSNALRVSERDLAELTMKYIHKNYSQRLTIKELCTYFHCSKSTLINSFEHRYQITVNKYITKFRIEKAQQFLRMSNDTILDIALRCGFADQGYFSKVFQKEIGMTPSAYRISADRTTV